MRLELPEIRPEERTPLVEALLAIIRELLDRNQQLEETVLQLRDEIAVLKGQKPRPKIKPSSLESATPPSQQEGSKKEKPDKRGSEKRSKNAELTIHRRVPLHIDDLPPGAVFKGYEDYIVQELVIESRNILYLRARYQLPDGSSVLAPLPADVIPGSHYGPTLMSYILHQYHNGLTQPLLLEQLHDFGIDISAGHLQAPFASTQKTINRTLAISGSSSRTTCIWRAPGKCFLVSSKCGSRNCSRPCAFAYAITSGGSVGTFSSNTLCVMVYSIVGTAPKAGSAWAATATTIATPGENTPQ
jgi:hypothetical protein